MRIRRQLLLAFAMVAATVAWTESGRSAVVLGGSAGVLRVGLVTPPVPACIDDLLQALLRAG